MAFITTGPVLPIYLNFFDEMFDNWDTEIAFDVIYLDFQIFDKV